MRTISLTPRDALLLVDLQNDFLPGGSLGVPGGDQVIAPANRLSALFHQHALPVYASRDWHPPNHCSFAAQGGPWPPHCVAETQGAAFAPGLVLPAEAVVISKGTTPGLDAYSAFNGTTLAAQLQAQGIERLAICGIATDYCVLNTVTDALALGFKVLLVPEAVRPVDVQAGDGDRALELMVQRGAVLASLAPASMSGAPGQLLELERQGSAGHADPVPS
jgi:nicotinamidase/pyrazinamidase